MGSWSVYCGISNLTINSGQKCVLLPLKKTTGHRGYLPFVPDGYDCRLTSFTKKLLKKAGEVEDKQPIYEKYVADYKTFGNLMCQLTSIRFNLHCMSHYWAPFVQYLTPQCGELKAHQVILEKFASINKEYLLERGYDDDDYDEDENFDETELTEDESN